MPSLSPEKAEYTVREAEGVGGWVKVESETAVCGNNIVQYLQAADIYTA